VVPGPTLSITTPLLLYWWCYLWSGYQRELRYRHSDGSYSAWGGSDEVGSLWLTAFVVRSFARARPFIYIDPSQLGQSIDWIRAQQLDNGCFRPVYAFIYSTLFST